MGELNFNEISGKLLHFAQLAGSTPRTHSMQLLCLSGRVRTPGTTVMAVPGVRTRPAAVISRAGIRSMASSDLGPWSDPVTDRRHFGRVRILQGRKKCSGQAGKNFPTPTGAPPAVRSLA